MDEHMELNINSYIFPFHSHLVLIVDCVHFIELQYLRDPRLKTYNNIKHLKISDFIGTARREKDKLL